MSCTPHPQVMSPCEDDTLPVENALAVSGDISFDEEGSIALTEGQTSAEIEFGFQKETAVYVFEYLYVKSTGDDPVFIAAVPSELTTRKFTVKFTGAPVAANCTLYWRVKVPDGLHSCPSLQNGPKYAIVRPTQEGIEPFPEGQDFVAITLPLEEDDSEYNLLAITVENTAAEVVQVFPYPTVTSRTTLGFRLDFGSFPEESGYTVHWKIG